MSSLRVRALLVIALSGWVGGAYAQDAGNVQLTIANPTGSQVDIYEMTAAGGQPQFLQSLAVGATSTVQAPAGAMLVFGINQQSFEQYQVTADAAQQLTLSLDGQAAANPPATPAPAPVVAPSPPAMAAQPAMPAAPTAPALATQAPAIAPAPAAGTADSADGVVAMLAPFISGQPRPAGADTGSAFPAAASLGGSVLSAPTMGSASLGNLTAGEPVVIVQDTGVALNGFDWFEVNYGGTRTGYQWGAYLCGKTQPIAHSFGVCGK